MFWSQITIPGRPRLLMVDGSGNAEGWEGEFCQRISHVLQRKEVDLVCPAPLRVTGPEELGDGIQQAGDFNCLLLMCHGVGGVAPRSSVLRGYWDWLTSRHDLSQKLFAACTWDHHDPETASAILAAKQSFARLAVVPQSPLSPRAAGLFFMKLFAELDLHAQESITGKMVWFSHSKAREILKRRHLPGQVGVRC